QRRPPQHHQPRGRLRGNPHRHPFQNRKFLFPFTNQIANHPTRRSTMMNKPPLSSTIASLLSLTALTPALVLPPGAFANGDGTFGAQSAESVVAREQARRADYARRAEAAIET